MFRRAATVLGRIATGAAGVQIGAAAAVALTDKELSKKPDWYQIAVKSLEDALKATSKKGFIESPSVLQEAEEALSKISDEHNTEIQWRFARILIEKADLTKDPKEKAHLLHEAKEHVKKALAVEPAKGSAGVHKWFAILLSRLDAVEKSNHGEDIIKHLEKSVSLDNTDPYAFHLLGVAQYNNKDHKKALENFAKAEEIRRDFSANNHYYSGLALKASGKKDDAIKSFKQSVQTLPRNSADEKARSLSKGALASLGLKPEEINGDDL
ncbi:unnamed protein product [Auanema sp. JU1783]|nr:unnamed protein product [Auanema sp. JU1783]